MKENNGKDQLLRVLGAWSAASILVGAIIGSGIFKKPSTVAAALPSPGWILVCWIVAGGLAFIGSLILAELGSSFPEAGGQYTYLRAAFGDFTAFLFGWTNLVIINTASIAALGVISAEFAFNLIPEPSRPPAGSHWYQTLPVLLIGALAVLNAAGVRWGAGVQNVFTVLKLGAVALIISALFVPQATNWSNFSPFWELRDTGSADPGASIWLGFKGAFLAIFWAYDGWYLLSFSGGEIRQPQRNIPRGFVLGILIVIGAYVAFNVAVLALIDLEEMVSVTRFGGVAGEAAFRAYGEVGLTLLSVGIVCSTFGAANANILTGSRLSFAMARDGLFFRSFGAIHRRFFTPIVAIAAQGLLGAIYVYAGTFDQLTDAVVFAAWIFYLLTVIGYFRLRRTTAAGPSTFRAPGFPLLPAIFVAFAAVFIVYSLLESVPLTAEYLRGSQAPEAANGIYLPIVIAIITAGLPLYWLLAHRRRRDV